MPDAGPRSSPGGPGAAPRLAAVDYGTRRVGLAVTDPLRLFASPLGAYSPDEALAQLRALHATDGLEAVVIGWPFLEDGSEGTAIARVKPYVRRIERALPGVPVVPVDERFSSRRASEAIHAAGTMRRARLDKGRVDAAAAALILQDYLDGV